MNKRLQDNSNKYRFRRGAMRQHAKKPLWPALLAIGGGCSLITPVSAVELGELRVHSRLGQPLRASVAYALQPNEMLAAHCLFLAPRNPAVGPPSIANADISVADGIIRLAGRTALREPLLTLQLTVDCPYTPHLRREYAVFLNPAASPEAAATAASAGRTRSPLPASRVTPRAARSVTQSPAAPVSPDERYRVEPGDTLSGIAQRIGGRRVGIWQAVDALFAANPNAFINNDRNLLRAGAELIVPRAILTPRVLARDTDAGTASARTAAATSGAEQDTGDAANAAVAAPSVYLPELAPAPAETTADGRTGAGAARQTQQRSPRIGDVARDSGSPFISPVSVDDEATAVAAPVEAVSTPALRRTSPATSDSWSPLAWLGGSGLLLILALLLGRRLTDHFDASAWVRDAFGRRRSMYGNRSNDGRTSNVDAAHADSAPVARMISLNSSSSDLSGSSDNVDVAEDFGFADSSDFATDLVYGRLPSIAAPNSTDIIATQRVPESTIVESEIPPTRDDTSEYDVSMIVDATKQSAEAAKASTKDLQAIEVEVKAAGSDTGTFTLSEASDYKILEQDYEDELSATQALNAEIAKAAREMTLTFGPGSDEENSQLASMDFTGWDAETSDEDTEQMPLPDEDTDVHQAVERKPTGAENDATVEMDVDRGNVDTRKKRAS